MSLVIYNSLPVAVVGFLYDNPVIISGGTPPYTGSPSINAGGVNINPGGNPIATGTPTSTINLLLSETVKDSVNNMITTNIPFAVVAVTPGSKSTTSNLSLNQNIINLGANVLLTATIIDSNSQPVSGVTVNFISNAVLVGSGITNINGVATFTYTPSALGTYIINAVYPGSPTGITIAGSTSSSQTLDVVLCIHSSSKISLANDMIKPICDLTEKDILLAANGQFEPIEKVIKCWTKPTWMNLSQPCIVFEKDSLGFNTPTERFAIDPEHPICTPTEYFSKGDQALKPASHYLCHSNNIWKTHWDDIRHLFLGENCRYDIVMSAKSCKTYIANGVIVKSRAGIANPGYEYY